MSRPPHARAAVLAAAEAIVKDIGAANLTFDELVRRSGITRGGIVYHFPTKTALLAALVEHDLAQWDACVASKRAGLQGPAAALRAHLASGTEPDEHASRLCAGLLSATVSDRTLAEPWRRWYAREHRDLHRTSADPVLATILSLAADGLFWRETLGLSPLTTAERRQVTARLLQMAESAGAAAGEAAAPASAAPPAVRPARRQRRPA
jgi:AcrR family transcriptional regulator